MPVGQTFKANIRLQNCYGRARNVAVVALEDSENLDRVTISSTGLYVSRVNQIIVKVFVWSLRFLSCNTLQVPSLLFGGIAVKTSLAARLCSFMMLLQLKYSMNNYIKNRTNRIISLMT